MSENNSIVFDTTFKTPSAHDELLNSAKAGVEGLEKHFHGDAVLHPGTIVRHFKGKLYKVICTAIHTETATELVIYQAMYPPFHTYARPKEMFLSKVDEEKYPEHAGEWRLRIATPEEIQGCDKNASSPMP